MVMRFRKRLVEGHEGMGAPTELDCDALWDRAFRPALEALGFLPIRADADTGSVIVQDMLERLAYADLVLADVTLPNGNVYYEVGLRHAARRTGCVLIAADWSRQLFDIGQIRTIRYPLTDGLVPQEEAERIKQKLIEAIPPWREQITPWHSLVSDDTETIRQRSFRDQSEQISNLQARITTARRQPKAERAVSVRSILVNLNPASLSIPMLVVELLQMVRDSLGLAEVLPFILSLPDNTRSLAYVREQELLALAESGEPLEAIARLEELVREQGDSAERQGLIGGRYKRLWKQARDERLAAGAGASSRPSVAERRYLNKAIDHYSQGMEIDLNAYYCSSNLPQLLIARGKPGDGKRAEVVEHFVVAACDRARKRGVHDEWLRPTLLGAAFRARDTEKAADLAEAIETEGPAAWQLHSTLADLKLAVSQAEGHDSQAELAEIYEQLVEVAAHS